MGKINVGRVILGGILAGVIVNASEFVINAVILKQQWADALTKLGKPPGLSGTSLVGLNIAGFLLGIAAVWLYAAIRSRFGAGAKTAVIAALATWVVGYALPATTQISLGIPPPETASIATGLGLVEMIVATLAGAFVYKEDSAEQPVAMSASAR